MTRFTKEELTIIKSIANKMIAKSDKELDVDTLYLVKKILKPIVSKANTMLKE